MALAELSACLTLVSPSGMSADDRTEWLKVAHRTLAEVPADLMERGCTEARKTCRFASEIVPAILAEIEQPMKWRKANAARSAPPPKVIEPAPKEEYVSAEAIRGLIRKIGHTDG